MHKCVFVLALAERRRGRVAVLCVVWPVWLWSDVCNGDQVCVPVCMRVVRMYVGVILTVYVFVFRCVCACVRLAGVVVVFVAAVFLFQPAAAATEKKEKNSQQA